MPKPTQVSEALLYCPLPQWSSMGDITTHVKPVNRSGWFGVWSTLHAYKIMLQHSVSFVHYQRCSQQSSCTAKHPPAHPLYTHVQFYDGLHKCNVMPGTWCCETWTSWTYPVNSTNTHKINDKINLYWKMFNNRNEYAQTTHPASTCCLALHKYSSIIDSIAPVS